ncbi:hypothetical protein IGI37_001305 [Enterococcus sp. AZ194]|uniref:sugar-binding transcriptional regulator n=1 Tax=Enterococcus sp. AZ194 TaxID=2774629 RepID=UPI003F2285F9
MNEERRRLLAKIAYLHFVEGKSQTEISVELDIYRTTISRMITKAREEGIVKIEIKNYNIETFALEAYMQAKYGLKRIEIIDNQTAGTKEYLSEAISRRAANMVRHVVKEQDIVGISWGSTLRNMVEKLEVKTVKHVLFCPLAGGPSHINTKYHVNTLVYEMSRVMNGQTVFINAAVVQESERVAFNISQSSHFQKLMALWNTLDVAIVGIGGNLTYDISQWRDLLTQSDYDYLKKEAALGEVCCRFFNEEGTPVHNQLQKRILGLTLEQLGKVPKSIAVAYGEHKAQAILAVVKKKYINHLVTDKITVLKMLQLDNDHHFASDEEEKTEVRT